MNLPDNSGGTTVLSARMPINGTSMVPILSAPK
jgi:hypothetical protein